MDITGVHLYTTGDADQQRVVVSVEINGRWREVINTAGGDVCPISHIVEESGLIQAFGNEDCSW